VYSSSRSSCLAGLIPHVGNEQIGDAGRTHVAERGESLTIYTIEQQDAATNPWRRATSNAETRSV